MVGKYHQRRVPAILRKNVVDSTAVILHIKPITDILTLAVNGKRLVVQRVRYHQRNKLFGEMIGSVISLISVLGVTIYTVCCLPYIGNSETYVPLVMARDCIRTKSVLSPSFVHRNVIFSFTSAVAAL